MTLFLHRLPLLIVAMSAIPSAAHAHVLDEYLQATLVAIEPSNLRLHINLTPGVEVAEEILAEIDQNLDGAISNDEAAAYAEMLKRDLTVRIDGRHIELKHTASNIPDLAELRSGHGIIQMVFSVSPGSFTPGQHGVVFENRHFSSIGAYLFNAARPQTDSVRIIRQNRNTNQSAGEIEFAYSPPSRAGKMTGIVTSLVLLLFVTFTAVYWVRRRSPRRIEARLGQIGTDVPS